MRRLIDILKENQASIIQGNFLDAWNKCTDLGNKILSNKEQPIKANEEEILQLYGGVLNTASETPGKFPKYDIISVGCIHLLIGLECYVKADAKIQEFLTHYITQYFSALGLEEAQNGPIKMDAETKRKLEATKIQEEVYLEKYWTNTTLLYNTVRLIFNVFQTSYNKEAKHQAKWEEVFDNSNYKSCEEFLEMVGIDEKTDEIITRGKSIWFDAHIKALFVDIDPELGPIPLRTDREGPYFGFFVLLKEKTGYNVIDPKKRILCIK